ncbi:MAG: hypothetical protein HC798_00510 [Polaribacter sp.]|nr:hypothetical protein [Polaribacter sp.]
MKKIVLLFCVIGFTKIQSQTNLYENPKFDEIAKTHKNIAILPFKASVKLRPKQMD